MDRDQKLAQLEQLLAEIRTEGRGEVVQDAALPRPSGGLPTAYEYGAGTQYQPLVPRPVEMPPVASAIVDQYGRPVVYQPTPISQLPQQAPKVDVLTQRMVGGGVLLLGGGVGGAFLLHAAAAAVIPLALIAIIVVSLVYLKHSGRSGGNGANVNVNVSVKTSQRNG